MVLAFFVFGLVADSPREAASNKKVLSPNGRFYAIVDAAQKRTTVFQVSRPPRKVWEMPGWNAVTFLANDGDHLAVGYAGSNLLELNAKPDEPMVVLYHRGERVSTITLRQIVKDYKALPRTESHVAWGDYLGFDSHNQFLLRTNEGGTFVVTTAGELRQSK